MPKKTISAEEFMQQRQGRKRVSKLEPFKADILKLKNNGFTQEQILEFLALNHVQVGLTTLNSFIRSRANQRPEHVFEVPKTIVTAAAGTVKASQPPVKRTEQKMERQDGYVPPAWATQKSEEDIF